MYYAKIDDCYISDNAVFYRVSQKLPMDAIVYNRLNKSESIEDAVTHWKHEQHWLADWKNKTPFDGFYKNCEVSFEIASSTYYPTMRHKSTVLEDVRNINIINIKKLL